MIQSVSMIYSKVRMPVILLVLFCFVSSGQAQFTSQWRGPQRSGIYPDTGLLTSWPEGGPELLWSVNDLGKGYSSAAVTDDAVYITGMKDSTDNLTKLTKDGEIVWSLPFGRTWTASFPDTRTTPTIEGNRIYVISGTGDIACIDAENGSLIWGFDAVLKFEGRWGDWGICESLLLVDNNVIYSPAGPRTTLVALNKYTGETTWESESLNDTSAYVSPILFNYNGKKIIVTTNARHLVGVDALYGNILWGYDYAALLPDESLKVWPGAPFTNTITPLVSENGIYITGGYNHVGAMFEIYDEGRQIKLIWTDSTIDCHHGGVVKIGDYIYGANWINNANGNWCCIDWITGKPQWEEKWFTKGSIIAADGMLYCYEEKTGNLGLVKPTPEKFDLISSFKITDGTGPHWSHPVVQHGVLYVRHGDVLMAYDVRKQ